MSPPSRLRLRLIVILLGVSVIISYGTAYYCYAIFAPAISAEFAIDVPVFFGLMSCGLLSGGLAGPFLGRLMDRFGAARLMAIGSVLCGSLIFSMGMVPSLWAFSIILLVMLTLAPLLFYAGAFSALAQASPTEARQSITNLTLIAGFASSVFWPLSGWLLEAIGWRSALMLYGVANIALCLPLHAIVARLTVRPERRSETIHTTGAGVEHGERRRTFWLVAVSFALSAVVGSAVAVHMVPVLQTLGLGATAFALAALFGPSQIVSRLVEAIFWRRLHPVFTALVAAGATTLCCILLLLPIPPIAAALLFVVFFGISQGLAAIVGGTLTLKLFGPHGYGELLGRLGMVRVVFSAGAPFLLSLSMEAFGLTITFLAMFVISAGALPPLLILFRRHGLRG